MTPEEFEDLAARIREAMTAAYQAVADLLRPIVEAVAAWVAEWWPLIERALRTSRRFRAFQRHRPVRPAWAMEMRRRRCG